jgi:hypothetical protein
MLRVFGLFCVAGGSAYLAMHNGVVAGVDLKQMPLEMIGFLVATCGLIYSLRHI